MHPSGLRVLIVDDERAFVDVLAKRLARRGFVVQAAHDAAEALRALRGSEYDIAILDLKLEDIDGVEILKMFTSLVPGMPVVMITGHGSESAMRTCLKIGAVDYLSKPVELDELVELVRRHGGRKGVCDA